MVNKVRFRLVGLGLLGLGLGLTEFTETATVDDNDGISKHMLINAYITYFITQIIDDNWISAPTEPKNAS